MKPQNLSDFIGQEKIKKNLAILIIAARQSREPLDHILFYGPPGLGKSTLANVVANEMGVNIKVTSGSAIERAGDLAAILTNLRAGDVLFIDEVHRLGKAVEEVLYPAMEDYALDIIVGKGPSVRQVRLKLPRFTVIGTTLKLSQIDERLKSLMFEFDFAPYADNEICKIIMSSAKQQGITIDITAASLLAKWCNGSPAQALTLLKRARKHAIVRTNGNITLEISREAVSALNHKRDESESRERQPIPDDVKMFVWQRDGGCCVECGGREKLEFDHIIPVSGGGSNTARNIQLLCENCNRSKGAKIA
jgi:Holliday junction DNA helicase RuvB